MAALRFVKTSFSCEEWEVFRDLSTPIIAYLRELTGSRPIASGATGASVSSGAGGAGGQCGMPSSLVETDSSMQVQLLCELRVLEIMHCLMMITVEHRNRKKAALKEIYLKNQAEKQHDKLDKPDRIDRGGRMSKMTSVCL